MILTNVFGIPIEFLFFAATLLGIAFFHARNLEIAIGGLLLIVAYKLGFQHLDISQHLQHEWRLLVNLLGLLLGFAVLAKHFEESGVTEWLPRWLPSNWMGGFILLVMVGVLSSFLDNIAAAIIGGVIAKKLYKGRVSVGYLAAIVAAANAGGAGSVIGDTTTTMMWVAGVPALVVAEAAIAAVVAIAFSGIFASRAQERFQPLKIESVANFRLDYARLLIVVLIIVATILANIWLDFPAVGLWAALVVGAFFRPTHWKEMQTAWRGAVFLIALVLSASLMPVDTLPAPSWQSSFALGFVSAFFDNIPLTALALYQGGYDWGILAFAVGFGGSMLWFGSSAGVALSGKHPQIKNTWVWIKEGWHVIVAYVLGFFVMLATVGWHPG